MSAKGSEVQKDAKAKFVPKIKARLTVPTFKTELNTPRYFSFDAPIEHKKKLEKDEKTGKFEEKEISILRVTDLETGEQGQIVVGIVLEKQIIEVFGAKTDYVGRRFEVIKKAGPEGRRHKLWTLAELE